MVCDSGSEAEAVAIVVPVEHFQQMMMPLMNLRDLALH